MAPHQPPVRPARPEDSEPISRLQSLLAEPSPELLSATLAELPTDSCGAESRPAVTHTWTLLVSVDSADRPVGYLLAIGGEERHIAELAVDPDYRREGRAKALLRTVCTDASQPVTVHVAATNEAARSLYERVGFVEASRSSELFAEHDGLTLRYEPDENETSVA